MTKTRKYFKEILQQTASSEETVKNKFSLHTVLSCMHALVEDGEGGQGNALQDILFERRRQEERWGQQNHNPFTYLTILGEEYGEACQAALHDRFGGHHAGELREEMVQVAAVALAIVECLDRDEWNWNEH